MKKLGLIIVSALAMFFSASVSGQANVNLKGSVERIKVHGKLLEGNLSGDSPDRDVSVYLPPSYKKETKRRYPGVYFLHGFTDDDAKWYGFQKHWINLPEILDSVFTSGGAKEMIIVTPNAFTRFEGSMYSNSVTTGNWEDYIAKELVGFVDAHYRTIADASSRGLAGHSMGGYGTMRIGEKHPEIFSSLYLLSPCCMVPGSNMPSDPDAIKKVDLVKSPEDVKNADFFTKIVFASAAAWSPNPTNTPLYLDLPVKDGTPQTMVEARWWSNMPLATIDQNVGQIRKLKAIAFDAGDKDQQIAGAIKMLDSILNNYNIKHTYEQYEGDHVNRIEERIEKKMLAFFSKNLSFK